MLSEEERTHMGLGDRTASHIWKGEALVNKIKALDISQAGPSFELDGSVTPKGVGWVLGKSQQKEIIPLEFWPQLWKGAET